MMFYYNCGTNLNVDHRFCAKLIHWGCLKYSSNENDTLTYHFYAGYTYETITKFLSNYHDVSMSIKTLKRRFSEYGWKRGTERSQMM